MDSQSRQTASTYINNLLLSRGLLRNGTPIDFAKPEEAEGGLTATMSQAMNLVHDLILRRDRESDNLTNFATSLATLRATSTSQTATIARLEANAAALDRQLALTAAQERAARSTLHSAETRNRALREEIVRLKGSVAQVRAQCTTDVRRRDGEIARLKRHLEGRRGRDGAGLGVGVVLVTSSTSGKSQGSNREVDEEGEVDFLKQETTEFLTRLSQELSDENDALISLVKGTLATLRSLQGLPQGPTVIEGEIREVPDDMGGFMNGPPSVDALALSTDEVLEHLRGLLTNPSFVPLEEVEVREEEIQRLREGWEKMALRWKEAMFLMDGWKKRVVDTGDTINLDDLKDGLKLGNGIPSATEARVSPAKKDADGPIDDSSMLQASHQQHDDDILEEVASLSEPLDEADLAVPRTDRALTDKSANARPVQEPRKVSFPSVSGTDNPSIITEDELSMLDFSKDATAKTSPAKKPSSRIPLQTRTRSPERTVQQKLERAQAEAEQTRQKGEKRVKRDPVKKKLKGSRRRSTLSPEELENLMGVI